MKKCPRCGKEYSEAETVCPLDGHALDPCADEPAPPRIQRQDVEALPAPEQPEAPGPAEPDSNAPEGFRSLGCHPPHEADPWLRQFQAEGIEFQIGKAEAHIPTRRGVRVQMLFEIFVIEAQAERAWKIISADWKV
jgi:hypothetical protein